jgi:ubiquinone biosynthesis accessory factor UbiJ
VLDLPLALALNHLLKAEPWARERLIPFAGQTVELRAAFMPRAGLLIEEGGTVRAAPPGAVPALVVSLGAEAPIALLRGEEHLMRAVQVSGDPLLAEAVMALVRHLRWDAEEDLSRVMGDIAAHRVAQTVRSFAAWQADAGSRLAQSIADYLTEEQQLLLQQPEHDAFAAEVGRLRDAVERLDKRIRQLG